MGVNLEPTLEINVDPQVRFPFHGAGMARSRRRFGRMGEAEVALVIADVAVSLPTKRASRSQISLAYGRLRPLRFQG
jgi:hypothetical protein